MTLKQSQGHQNYTKNMDPDQVIITQSLKVFAFNSVWEKGNVKVFSNDEICQLSPLIMHKKKKEVVYSCSTWCIEEPYKVSI